jgi:hypothetical protein
MTNFLVYLLVVVAAGAALGIMAAIVKTRRASSSD